MMKPGINTKVLSGFVELLPGQQAVFDQARRDIECIYKSKGFVKIETPAIERSEVLLSKSGGETEKQIYGIAKSGHDDDMALRFDLTVPFARYIAEHYGDLIFPFKRYSVDKVWRGERAQKGRFREFYQADVDIVAENELDIAYDAEVIATLAGAIAKIAAQFGLGKFAVRVSNRRIWSGFFEENELPAATRAEILSLLDRRLKMSGAEFDAALGKFGGLASKISAVMAAGEKSSPELARVMELLRAMGVPAVADPSIVRGLDYYTGTVFETFFDDRPELGSVASGGRYEKLCAGFTDRNIMGVGGSIGLSRLLISIIEGIEAKTVGPDVLIIPISPELFGYALKLEVSLAAAGISASALLNGRKLKKNMEYADKIGAKYVLPIGGDEFESKSLTLKDMETGEQRAVPMDNVADVLKDALKP